MRQFRPAGLCFVLFLAGCGSSTTASTGTPDGSAATEDAAPADTTGSDGSSPGSDGSSSGGDASPSTDSGGPGASTVPDASSSDAGPPSSDASTPNDAANDAAPPTSDASIPNDAAPPTADASITDASTDAPPPPSDASPPPDAQAGSGAALDCFSDWQAAAPCPAPVLTAAYLSDDCEGTTGVFVTGSGFEGTNVYLEGVGILPGGPSFSGGGGIRANWNLLTPTLACLTTSATPSTWSGFALVLTNPDGNSSNAVTVADLLGARPPFVSTGSSDPFDPDACLDPGMTMAEALTLFAPAASSASLGNLPVESHTRACNAATGCAPWAAASTLATAVTAGLATTGGGTTVDFTFGGIDCGVLGHADSTVTYNSCPYSTTNLTVHVAEHCLRASSTVYSSVAGDGSYTQTDTAGLLRY